jgi:phospholipid/cholesterol/gamma-HCH transport system ATP-binding protein
MSESPQTPASRRRPDSDEPIISVQNVVVRYGSNTVLDHLNLEIYPGETMVILGGSGSGKSTLLRQMEALEKPTSGRVLIKGIDVTERDESELVEIRRIMGVSFQSAAMFNSLTLAENVALPLREHTKLAESTIQLITRMKLEQVGLANAEHLYPAQLSGGMRKRASVARAMAMDPEILFFDEPSAGLDPIIAAGIDELILHLKNAFKMTIVIVTHEMASAFLIGDRMCFLHEGKMITVGNKEEIRNSTHPRIRQFLERIPDHMTMDEKSFLERLTRK